MYQIHQRETLALPAGRSLLSTNFSDFSFEPLAVRGCGAQFSLINTFNQELSEGQVVTRHRTNSSSNHRGPWRLCCLGDHE